MRSTASAYRADIDGLRAVAVLLVVLFHAGVPGIAGGFVGVDVFFVISGFLITRIILPGVEAGTFSVARFYERRIRRIFPALAIMLLLTIVGTVLLDTPDALEKFGRSLTETALFVSNVGFWRDTGYFAEPAASRPLLHTWSLSVEEQFYIIYPVTIMLIRRYGGRRYAWWLALLAASSLAASIHATHTHRVAAFYLAPFRAWELMIGALLAVGVIPTIASRRARTTLAAAGVAFILASAISFHPTIPFPGLWALLPTCGAGLVIYAGIEGETAVGRLLALRPLVFIGLISYSLYLLHWPLLMFARQFAIVELSPLETTLTLLLAFLLSVCSWRFVERPFRSVVPGQRRRLFVRTALALSVFVALGISIARSRGVPARFAAASFAPDVGADAQWAAWHKCEQQYSAHAGLPCQLGAVDEKPTFALWGDSHALALASGVSTGARRVGSAGVLLAANGCPPLIGVRRSYIGGATACDAENDRTVRYLTANPEVKTVILAGRWSLYWVGRSRGESGDPVRLDDVVGGSGSTNADVASAGLVRTVHVLQALGRRVAIVRAVPEIEYDVPRAAQSAYLTGRDFDRIIAPTRRAYLIRNRQVLALIDSLREATGVDVVSVDDVICDSRACHVTFQGRLLYRDDDHLSTFGSVRLAELFANLLKNAAAQ